jgi:hypothetical protein
MSVKLYSHCGKTVQMILKKLNLEIPTSQYIHKRLERNQKDICAPTFIAALFTIAKNVETVLVH